MGELGEGRVDTVAMVMRGRVDTVAMVMRGRVDTVAMVMRGRVDYCYGNGRVGELLLW